MQDFVFVMAVVLLEFCTCQLLQRSASYKARSENVELKHLTT